MSDFGKWLQLLRKERNMSQKKLASLCGVSPSYLSRVERGQRSAPSPAILKKIARQLGLSEYDMLELAGHISKENSSPLVRDLPAYWDGLISDTSVDEALRVLGNLTAEEKKSISLYLLAIKLQREEKSRPSE